MKRIEFRKAGVVGRAIAGASIALGIAGANDAVAAETSGLGAADHSVEYKQGTPLPRSDADSGRGASLDVVPGVYIFAAASSIRPDASTGQTLPHAATKPQTGMGAIVPTPHPQGVVTESVLPKDMQAPAALAK